MQFSHSLSWFDLFNETADLGSDQVNLLDVHCVTLQALYQTYFLWFQHSTKRKEQGLLAQRLRSVSSLTSFSKNNEQKEAKAALMTLNLIGIPCQVWPWEDISHSWSDSRYVFVQGEGHVRLRYCEWMLIIVYSFALKCQKNNFKVIFEAFYYLLQKWHRCVSLDVLPEQRTAWIWSPVYVCAIVSVQ